MMSADGLRIAWLIPSMALGSYWHPVLSEFTKIYRNMIVYTGVFPGFAPGFEDTFAVEIVGEMKFVDTVKSESGYSEGFIYASPAIIGRLRKFKPDVIFTTGFCIWTILALLFKPLGRWQVVISYEGSSPGVDYRHSPLRLFLRRWIAHFADAFITNSLGGKHYLMNFLNVDERSIFVRPYEVPDSTALLNQVDRSVNLNPRVLQRPVFLFTGQLVVRKGLHCLLEACTILKAQGYQNYTLLVAGDGDQREQLQAFSAANGLEDCVQWLGWVSYGQLGAYFRDADVFILPTLEDTWGMVVLEAMAFGKPVLCSKWAGASELLIEGENGYLFDPHEPEAIAAVMRRLIDQSDLIQSMGQRSQEIIAEYTPTTAAQFLAKVTNTVARI